MTDDRNERQTSHSRRRIRWTVALLAGLAALIYLGFISRGVLG
jgi:hypothetical protein